MSHRAIRETVLVETSGASLICAAWKRTSFLGCQCEHLLVLPLYFFIESVRKSMLKSTNWRVCICQSNRSDSPQRVSIRPLSLYRMATMMNEINYLTYSVKSIPWWLCGIFWPIPPASGTDSGTAIVAASLRGLVAQSYPLVDV